MASGRFVSYLRVSTDRQGKSGLGLQAQREAVANYLNGGPWELVAELVEVESGKRQDRPQLDAALMTCRLHRATLVVAKLDRLARNAKFLLHLIDSGVDVVFCDLPHVPSGPTGRFLLTQMAAVAELEAGLISQRTKAALAAAKARGVKLGSPGNLTADGRARGSEVGRAVSVQRADRWAADLAPTLNHLVAQGITSATDIAAKLNQAGVPAARGGKWQAVQVQRLLARMNDLPGHYLR
ncbi:recombinase family protein [Magnetospirillum sp. 64-120]|uniref:recombinase family protein n=1 Tax=Magnetospirillum sp. 64-120 TaxID=1895778 RepID=UPI00092AE4B2|nr:recombinase family protein [Magnetospirillum sp. 64-120]OJX79947.1 MAG: resolvase [Magnetospirillum sp. 64-120]